MKSTPLACRQAPLFVAVLFCLFVVLPLLRAQTDTTASLGGSVTAADTGRPIMRADVTLRLAATGEVFATHTNMAGQYMFIGLCVDDGYTLTVSALGSDTQRIGPFSLNPGEEKLLDAALASPKEEIVHLPEMRVVAEREQPPPGAASLLAEDEVEERPSSDQSTINDYATSDPRVTMLDPESGEMTAAGQNFRFNSVQLDGMRMDDQFGLSVNGLPTQGNPFSMETVQSVSVDLAPYDVTRGGFTGASVNAVTKSGSNVFSGSVYYSFRNEKFRAADPLTGTRTPFTSQVGGFTLGGPIVKNRLFFFISWERSVYTNPAREAGFAPDTAALERIVSIARDQYGFDAGALSDPGERSRVNDRYMMKLDWRVNAMHRLAFTYNGSHGSQPNYARYAGATQTSLSSHWYATTTNLDLFGAQLVSKWSDAFQTQVSASHQHITAGSTPNSVWPSVGINNVPAADGGAGGTVWLGSYYNNQINDVATDTTQGQIAATWLLGRHKIEFGGMTIRSDFTNDYLPYAWGGYTFSNIDNFASGYFNTYNYQRPLTGDGSIPGAHWGYAVNTLFIQDTWRPFRALTLTAGVRYDYPEMGQRPAENATFEKVFGMRNDGTINGAYTLGPRLSFLWAPGRRRLRLRGGAGVFQGRAPGVWLSNAFTNNGATSVRTSVNNSTLRNYAFSPDTAPPAWAATGATPSVPMNLMSNRLRLPAVTRGNLALDLHLPWQRMVASAEWLGTRALDSLVYRDINLDQTAVGPDGRPLYGAWSVSSAGAVAHVTNSQYKNTGSYGGTTFNDVYLLTNADRRRDNSQSSYLTFSLKRPVRNHWGLSIAYTRGHATDVSPFTNSTAQANFFSRVGVDPNSDETGTASTEVRDRVLTILTFRFALIRKFNTTISLINDAHSGRPYSFSFTNDANGDGRAGNDLFYVPSGPNDPNVYWTSQADKNAFFSYLATNNNLRRYAGRIVPRNSERSSFVNRLDLRVSQQIPFYGTLRAELVCDLLNLTNLLNPKWGDVYQYNAPYAMPVASGYYDPRTGQYAYSFRSTPRSQSLLSSSSRWQIQTGLKIKF